jgi:hypothetical protein
METQGRDGEQLTVQLLEDGKGIGKSPVSLTSRPPQKIGLRPGETPGGHTVYVLPDVTRVVSVRWSSPGARRAHVTWSVED